MFLITSRLPGPIYSEKGREATNSCRLLNP